MKTVKTSIESLLPLITESFNNDQEISFTVIGTSMSPTLIHNKTTVTLKESTTLKKKHIYLYKYQDKILLHRYIKTKNNIHLFKGDNCANFEYVEQSSLIGVVTKVNNEQFKISLKTRIHLLKRTLKEFIKKLIRG